jgi:hypothetical protein
MHGTAHRRAASDEPPRIPGESLPPRRQGPNVGDKKVPGRDASSPSAGLGPRCSAGLKEVKAPRAFWESARTHQGGEATYPHRWLSQHSLGVFRFLFLGHPPWPSGGLGPGEPFPRDRNTRRALAGFPPRPLLSCPVLLKEGLCRGSCATIGQPGRTRGSHGSHPGQHASQGATYGSPPDARCGDKP